MRPRFAARAPGSRGPRVSAQADVSVGAAPGRSIASIALQGAAWTIGIYAIAVFLRFGSNVALSRLITPEVFGTVMIIMTLRNGIDLLSDVGIGQNVVNNKDGERPEFYNTAWTVQIARGFVLFAALCLAAPLLASAFQAPVEAIQIGAFTLAILGFTSTAVFMMQRRLQLARLNLFELAQDVISLVCTITAALISPTVWALLIGSVVATTLRVATGYLLPTSANRPMLNRAHLIEILSFGKWIYVWSFLGFLCMSFDRLFLGHAASLAVLGVYGIARTIADLPVALAGRLGHSLIFPLISTMREEPRPELRRQVGPLRLKFLLAGALCLAPAIVAADLFIEIVYDHRYHAAGWMLPVLLIGGWASVLCAVGDYVLLGLGQPRYGAIANCAKLAYLAAAVPLAFAHYGVAGAVMAIALAELIRYATLLFGQARERISFLTQDATATAALTALVLVLLEVRHLVWSDAPFDWTTPL